MHRSKGRRYSITSSAAFAERSVMEYPAHSFRLDVRCPDYLAPLLGFVGDELGEVGRRARKHRRAQIGNPRLHLGISEPSVYFVEFADYLVPLGARNPPQKSAS